MGATSRGTDLVVAGVAARHELVRSPYRYEFFQAVRLLRRLMRGEPPGRFAPPQREFVRFRAHQSLGFPASEIQALERPAEDGAAVMTVNFMGLTGPQGALPIVYTAQVIDRIRVRDRAMRDFFDLFNHRIISLFYRAWEKYRFAVAYEAGERAGLTRYLLDLIGLGTRGLQERQAVADDSLIFYTGLLAQRPRSATALRLVLEDYFGVPVWVEQFVGAWYPLAREDRCELDESDSFSSRLGVGAVVGDEVWSQQSRVRIVLGPLTRKQYLAFLPGGPAYEPLRSIVRFFGNQELEFEARLILKREETPKCELGAEGDEAPQLGWITWVNTAGMDHDPGDTVLEL